MKIALPSRPGTYAEVDPQDYSRITVFTWRLDRYGYVVRTAREPLPSRKTHAVLMHRVILDAPKGSIVDHVNGDTLDNRRANLRFCTGSQNAANSRPQQGRSSRFKGVLWDPQVKKWRAQLGVNGKRAFCGHFTDEEQAARAYDVCILEHFGEFARTNFPPPSMVKP